MLPRPALPCVAAIAMMSSLTLAQSSSPNGVKTLDRPGVIKAEGTWSLGARAGDFVFVADDIVEIDSISYAPMKK